MGKGILNMVPIDESIGTDTYILYRYDDKKYRLLQLTRFGEEYSGGIEYGGMRGGYHNKRLYVFKIDDQLVFMNNTNYTDLLNNRDLEVEYRADETTSLLHVDLD